MHKHAELIDRFYTAFARRDVGTMVACYAPDVHFTDEAFDLHGERAGEMWRMLCSRANDLEITHSDVEADDERGRARWVARYTYSQSGNKVENRVQARFRFRDGKIVEHLDSFDFWRWSRQALGLPGLLLGWSPFLQRSVRRRAAQSLDAWMQKKAGK